MVPFWKSSKVHAKKSPEKKDLNTEKWTSLTVWRKSLLFNFKGFTVFDCNGNLVYRVDDYIGQRPDEIVLMDGSGETVLTICRSKVNLPGGFYDAGDNVKFVWPMAFSVTLLSWAAVDFKIEISSAGEMAHLRAAIRWGTDFLLLAHTSPTTLYTQVGDGDHDHQCWERPEDMDTPRTLYKITSNSPGSEAAAEVSAALAATAIVFKGVDSNYSARLLNHSKSLFDFADKYKGSYKESCPFYCSYSGYQDELLWAAAWLHRASGEASYLNYAITNQGLSQSLRVQLGQQICRSSDITSQGILCWGFQIGEVQEGC